MNIENGQLDVRLNPDAEALLGYTAAVDQFSNSVIRFAHILSTAGIDPDFAAEVKETATVVMKRFRNEVEQSMTTVIQRDKLAFLLPAPEAKQ